MRVLDWIDRISFALSLVSGIAIGCVGVLIALEIVLRNFFGISLHFLWEYGVFVHMSAIFLGAGWTLRTGGHIRVAILKTVLPRTAEWISTLVALAISAYLSNALVQMAWTYFVSGRTAGSSTNTPLAIPAAMVALGSLVLTLQLVLRALRLAIGQPVELSQTGERDQAPIMD